MKKAILNITVCIVSLTISAQTSVKPTETVISTTVPVDYPNNQVSIIVNTITNCFDSGFSAYFTSYQRDEECDGLDLITKHVGTQIKYCPRTNNPNDQTHSG